MKRVLLSIVTLTIFPWFSPIARAAESHVPWWPMQAVDTMKYSRDLSRERAGDPSFDRVIDDQMREIAKTGATHVAIATPYDDEFIPMLRRWVDAARNHKLKIWFRGNLAGWEGWFHYPRIDRTTHTETIVTFIKKNVPLFQDGDIFSSCPECENGGPGDPRRIGDIEGYRTFIIGEYRAVKQAFAETGKSVQANYFSMNGDVARLIMDRETTKALDGLVVIDHYVSSNNRLMKDIRDIAAVSGGNVALGEFGAPIPDIHGNMTEQKQAEFIADAFTKLADIRELVGVSYWVNVGGETELWTRDGKAKSGVSVLTNAFRPTSVTGKVINELGKPISNARISIGERTVVSQNDGTFVIAYRTQNPVMNIIVPDYQSQNIALSGSDKTLTITLTKTHSDIWFSLLKFLRIFFPFF